MSHKSQSSANAFKDSPKPHNQEPVSIVLPYSMSQTEDQNLQRPIQSVELSNHDNVDVGRGSGRLSSRERSWVSNLFKKRRGNKKTQSANANCAGRSSARGQRVSRRSSSTNPKRSKIRNTQRSNPSSMQQMSLTDDNKPTRREDASAGYHTSPLQPEPSPHLNRDADQLPPTKTSIPVLDHPQRGREVVRHEVTISQPSARRNSVHLAHTPSNNYQATDESRARYASHTTAWGDFMRTPSKPTHADQSLTWPNLTNEQKNDRLHTYHTMNRHSPHETRAEHSPRLSLSPPAISSNPNVQAKEATFKPQECNLCGTPNSPDTRYGDLGIWLCTACRNPSSAIEVPPRKESKSYAENSLPQKPTRPRSKSQNSQISGATQEAENQWANFDSDPPYQTEAKTPSLFESPRHDWTLTNTKEDDNLQGREARFKPTPPLKDSAYLSRKLSTFSLDIGLASPPSRNPPPPPSRKEANTLRQETSWIPSRPSFVPSSPILSPSEPVSPLTPSPDTPRPQIQQECPRRPSSATPKANAYIAEIQNFPYPPPPIPKDDPYIHQQSRNRSSSIYPDDVSVYPYDDDEDEDESVPRLGTPDWERSPRRNTSFYDYWEVILGEHGRRYTVTQRKEM
ncbi:hypothetical protein ACLMJK_005948 [Lecanora helva]